MISVALAIPPALMTAFGLIYVEAVDGLDPTKGITLASLAVNMSMTLIPGIACLIGLIVWVIFYPLTGKVVEEMKKEVKKMHKQKREEYEKKRQS
jgi:Na+/melibiose symporter-like transporter